MKDGSKLLSIVMVEEGNALGGFTCRVRVAVERERAGSLPPHVVIGVEGEVDECRWSARGPSSFAPSALSGCAVECLRDVRRSARAERKAILPFH